jgi:hypothetical protein
MVVGGALWGIGALIPTGSLKKRMLSVIIALAGMFIGPFG